MTESVPFYVDRAKAGRANCKGCKTHCLSGELRLAKVVPSPYGEGQQMKSWFHVDCFMNALLKQRPATKRIDSIDDIGNWSNISKEDQEELLKKINEMEKVYAEKNAGKYTAKVLKNLSTPKSSDTTDATSVTINALKSEDDKFSVFCKLCKKIAKVDAYTEKTAVVNNFFTKGVEEKFNGDLALWCKLLLPKLNKRIYNLKSKQLVKLFSRIFNTDHDDMLTHLEQGDVAETIKDFFSKSKTYQPASESTLTIHNVENFLEELSKLTREEDQIYQFKKIVKKCTLDDLKMIIRLIKGDLRINAGAKHILDGVHPDAYSISQTSRDLNMVLDKVMSNNTVKHRDATQKSVQAELVIMTPVLPMLAEACKSIEMAMKKCPNGMFSEIKYDGERVQVHKKGKEFKYFSRALKPVMAHKVSHFKDYLPQAFPKGDDLVLDAEVLMVDVNTGKPLPFGTLGIHKQSEFKDAQVCLFVFDCLYYNGEVLMNLPIRKRRQILYEHMVEVKNHIMFSEQELIERPSDLAKMIAKVLQLGLEGLVLKDLESTYEPGKRHWLKVKKDYLFDGAMADTADLVVLGAWFGSGKKGGMMSVFLMGCLDTRRNKWVTVTKVSGGLDDSALDKLQKQFEPLMVKISQDSYKVPSWLDCNKGLTPDFVALDPKKQPVWEITGTEFTKAKIHTASGISVRFPRVTRMRDDKDWQTATNLDELKRLFITSKEKTDVSLLEKLAATPSNNEPNKKVIIPKKSPKIEKYFKIEKTSPSKKDTKETTDSSDSEGTIDEVDNEPPKKKTKVIPTKEITVKKEKLSPDSTKTKKVKTSPTVDKNESNMSVDKKEPKEEIEEVETTDSSDSEDTIDEVDNEPPKKKTKVIPTKEITVKKEKLSSDSTKTKKVIEEVFYPKNPLPDVFLDKRLGFYPDFISFPENERNHFERHWIGYGGTVVKTYHLKEVDYVVHNDDKISLKKMQKLKINLPSDVRHVSKYWLIKCINDVELCDTTKYPVFVEP